MDPVYKVSLFFLLRGASLLLENGESDDETAIVLFLGFERGKTAAGRNFGGVFLFYLLLLYYSSPMYPQVLSL